MKAILNTTKTISILILFPFFSIALNAQDIQQGYSPTIEPGTLINPLIDSAKNTINSKPGKAKKFAQFAYNISDSIKNNQGLASSAYYIGLADFEMGNLASALYYLDIALKTWQELGNKPQTGNVYNKIGSAYMQQGNYIAALENYLTSLEISKELGDSIGIAATYHNIGNIHYEQFEFNEALKHYNISAEIDSLVGDSIGLAHTLMNIGVVYMDMAEYSKALGYYHKSQKIFFETNDFVNIAGCYNNMAWVFQEQGNYQLALENYLKALGIYREIESQHGVASTSFSIGGFYNSQQQYTNAIKYLEEAMKLGKQMGSLKIESSAALAFSETYYHLSKYKKAYQYHVYYKRLSDLLKNEENVKRLTKVQMQYEFDQLQKEEKFKRQQRELAHQAELRQQRMFIAFLSIGMLFMISLAFLIYKSYRTKKRDNILLARQRDQIQKQKQEITDSILYAKRIQSAALPPKPMVDKLLDDYFILYKPRDIVSGDFYWINKIGDKTIIAAVDCTGHGVPGAFMSMLGISALNDTIKTVTEINAGIILNKLRELVIKSLHQKGAANEAKDGMDLAMVVIDKTNMKLQFAGAYNPLYLIRDNNLSVIKADRMPIGIFVKDNTSFSNHEIDIQPNDKIYIFSDGYPDQFGGPKGHKFKTKNFKSLLLEINGLTMEGQYQKLQQVFEEWKGSLEQIDDVIVIGINI